MGQAKGGKKLRRSGKKKGYYGQQFYRTAANKIRRLKKRLGFDPLAGEQIARLQSQRIG